MKPTDNVHGNVIIVNIKMNSLGIALNNYLPTQTELDYERNFIKIKVKKSEILFSHLLVQTA